MSQTRHYFSHNKGERGRLLTLPGDNVGGDGRVRYRSHISHYYPQIVDIRGYGAIHGSRSEEINHSSLFNVGESVDGVGRSGYRYRTSPSPSHHSGDHGRSSGFNSYGDKRSGHMYHTSKFYVYNRVGLKISHPRFPQEAIPRDLHG